MLLSLLIMFDLFEHLVEGPHFFCIILIFFGETKVWFVKRCGSVAAQISLFLYFLDFVIIYVFSLFRFPGVEIRIVHLVEQLFSVDNIETLFAGRHTFDIALGLLFIYSWLLKRHVGGWFINFI